MAGNPDLRDLFNRYGLGWMGKPSGSYFPKIVCEFYASYDAFIHLITPDVERAVVQPPITHIMVRGVRVNLFEKTIN